MNQKHLTDLPDPYDASAIFAFAMTFNGYEHFGSFDASVAAASSGDRSSLELIRNELFFVARASRHGDDDRFIDLYRQLIPFLQRIAIKRQKVRIRNRYAPNTADFLQLGGYRTRILSNRRWLP